MYTKRMTTIEEMMIRAKSTRDLASSLYFFTSSKVVITSAILIGRSFSSISVNMQHCIL